MAKISSDDTKPGGSTIDYHQIKSNFFRVIHVDGGVGGMTPRGYCHIALYSERTAIARVTTREVDGEGRAGPEITKESIGDKDRINLVRDIEVDLIFDPITAIQLRDWLTRRIAEFKETGGLLEKKDETDE